MNCRKCGKPLKPSVRYCLECGYYNSADEEDDVEVYDEEEYEELDFDKGGFKSNKGEELEFDEYDETDESPNYQNSSYDDFGDDDYSSSNDETYEEDEYEELDFDDNDTKKNKEYNEDGEDDYGFDDDDDSSIDSALVEAYIGNDYKSISKYPMNIFAIFFSWIYFIYKKMYLIGILGLALTGYIVKYHYNFIIIYIIITMILSGITFNPIYLFIVKHRVKQLKKRTNVFSEQKEICQKRGGTNLLLPFFSFAILLVFIILSSIKITTTKDKFYAQNTANQANCKSMARQAYKIVQDNNITGDIMGVACNITIENSDRSYNIYFKMNELLGTKHLYFENQENRLILLGNTDVISKLEAKEKNKTITPKEKEMLDLSNTLVKKYKSIEDDSEFEKRSAELGTNTEERKNFVFTKDEITE